jgi:hypothetical protein
LGGDDSSLFYYFGFLQLGTYTTIAGFDTAQPETLVLSAIYDLHQRLEILEKRLAAPQPGRAKRNAGD